MKKYLIILFLLHFNCLLFSQQIHKVELIFRYTPPACSDGKAADTTKMKLLAGDLI
jgi:hypothetical protein